MASLTKICTVSTVAAALGLTTSSTVASETMIRRSQLTQPQSRSRIVAQADNCRQVSSGIQALNVRREPSLNAEVIGTVAGGRNVTLDNLGEMGWAPISAPLQGYVSTRYLTGCDLEAEVVAPTAANSAIDADQCRQVIVRSGLNVRAEPSRFSLRLTALPTGTNVELAGPELEQWVAISEPVEGYVATRFLGGNAPNFRRS